MATKVFMEALSPTMEEGRLAKWLKNEGDAVKSGDVIAEVETDKAIMELVARGDGILLKRLIPDGATAPVSSLIGVIGAKGEDIAALVASAGAPVAAAPVAAAPVATVPASPSPRVPPAPAHAPAPPPPPPPSTNGGRTISSPLARRMAGEKGLDLSGVQGSGPGGRIIKRDIESAATAPRAASAPAKRVLSGAEYDDIALTQIRKTIARRLAESIGPIPTFYLTAEFDLERAGEMRTAMAAMGDEYKVSFNDIILKATATALAQHPEVNAHWLGDHIRYWNRVNLGMAVATDDGLIVPVIFDADQKRLSEISAESKALAKKARERKLKPEEFTGSSFSVSNLGMMQIEQFTAIINPPEVGILAIGAIEDKPVKGADGAVTFRKTLRVTMSCDHRAVDGAVGARFLQTLRKMIENPLMLVY